MQSLNTRSMLNVQFIRLCVCVVFENRKTKISTTNEAFLSTALLAHLFRTRKVHTNMELNG